MRDNKTIAPIKKPIIAAILNFFIPGVGQIYLRGLSAGFMRAVLWFVFVTIGYMFLFLPGFILHVICVFTAFYSASSSKRPAIGALFTVGGVGAPFFSKNENHYEL